MSPIVVKGQPISRPGEIRENDLNTRDESGKFLKDVIEDFTKGREQYEKEEREEAQKSEASLLSQQ